MALVAAVEGVGPNGLVTVLSPRWVISVSVGGLSHSLTMAMGHHGGMSVGGLAARGEHVLKMGRGFTEVAASTAFLTCSKTCCIMLSVVVDMKFLSASTMT